MRTTYGFTLIELMITLVVAAIVLTAGIPAFNRFIAANSAAADTNEVVSAVNFARSEAVSRGTWVSMCPANAALDACAAGAWQNGWLIFQDANGNGTYESANDTLIRTQSAPGGGTSLNATANSVRFGGSGSAAATVSFTVRPTPCNGDMERNISVSLTGLVETSKTGC